MLCSWEGNHRSGISLAMHHSLCGLSTYGLNGLRLRWACSQCGVRLLYLQLTTEWIVVCRLHDVSGETTEVDGANADTSTGLATCFEWPRPRWHCADWLRKDFICKSSDEWPAGLAKNLFLTLIGFKPSKTWFKPADTHKCSLYANFYSLSRLSCRTYTKL